MLPTQTVELPTFDALGVSQDDIRNVEVAGVAQDWFNAFSGAVSAASTADIAALFAPVSPLWRDLLSLSWDFHTKHGPDNIQAFLDEHLAASGFDKLKLQEESVQLQQLAPNLAWIAGSFSFETAAGVGSGIFRLVPTKSEGSTTWKSHTVFTNLEALKDFPEQIGALREQRPAQGGWTEKRKQEVEVVGTAPKPTVIIVGAGQGGLQVAARLKVLGVQALVVEKNARVGDQWRKRYDALTLHDPVWYDHMPYMPFPPTWPVFTPAPKLADWLECYAQLLELNVWTASTVTKAAQDASTGQWTVTINRASGEARTFTVNHLVFAHGYGGGLPKMPEYEGMDKFGGKLIHSSQYTTAEDFKGKKAFVIGACTSAHDICADFARHSGDVTMYQRNPSSVMSSTNGLPLALQAYTENGPPVDVADKMGASFPWLMSMQMAKGLTAVIKALDKDFLEALNGAGFKTWDGPDGTGFTGLLFARNGGYYPDTGSCQLIIDGKIKMKSDSLIKRFTQSGIEFEDGSTLTADAVICATGYGDAAAPVRNICGAGIASRLKPLWGLDEEGEVPGLWRPSGVRGLWVHMGNLAMGRFHSKYLAMQIKAIEEGLVPVASQSPIAPVATTADARHD